MDNSILPQSGVRYLVALAPSVVKIYALVRRNLIIYTENYIKLNFVTNSVVFDF